MSAVLIIDDEKMILDVFTQALTKVGHQVETAVDGKEGIEKFETGLFDVVITDVRMPGIDGNGVAAHIRKSQRQRTSIIAISGTPWLIREDRAHFDTILSKPFPLQTLVDTVKGLAEISSAAA